MLFSQSCARFYRPKNLKVIPFSKCRVLAIMAHHDDIEIGAHHWAYNSYVSGERDFFGVVLADGAGKKPRVKKYQNYSTHRMANLRNDEQELAADLGQYGGVWMLSHPSSRLYNQTNLNALEELRKIVLSTRPEIIITHNPLDLHPTHISTFHHVVQTVVDLPPRAKPKFLYGTEGWGDVTRWFISHGRKVGMKSINCSSSLPFLQMILGAFKSQNEIMSYDEAVPDMIRARANLMNPYRKSGSKGVQVVFDMSKLIYGKLTINQYYQNLLNSHTKHMNEIHGGFSV